MCLGTLRAGLASVTFFAASAGLGWADDASAAKRENDTYQVDRSGGRLFTAVARVRVLAEPRPDARALAEYPKGAVFAVIGDAVGTDYVFVSPCSTCENGFVQLRDLKPRGR